MAKPFEIIYSPDQWSAPPGGQPTTWGAPYGGLHVMAPENMIGPHHTPSMSNFIFRNAELRSRPAFVQQFKSPAGGSADISVGTFYDVGGAMHTFAVQGVNLYELQPGALAIAAANGNPWTLVAANTFAAGGQGFQWISVGGVLYFTSNSTLSGLNAWDGTTFLSNVAYVGTNNPPLVADLKFGAKYLTQIASHIILAYVQESHNATQSEFPNRIRWSNVGFAPSNGVTFGGNLGTAGATFDPNVNLNAGLNDLLDVPDAITGTMTVGRVCYIFRENGVTEMSPTGNGAAPFDFNHLWASQRGIGNVLPYSLAQYGDTGVFIDFKEVYQISAGGGLVAIGGGARDAIFADFGNAYIGNANEQVASASILPGYAMGIPYYVYELRIPIGLNATRVYVYDFGNANWARWDVTGSSPLSPTTFVWVS